MTSEAHKATAYLHEIKEPVGELTQVLSLSADNPWSGWLETYLGQCAYKCTPLYANEGQIMTERAFVEYIERSEADIQHWKARVEAAEYEAKRYCQDVARWHERAKIMEKALTKIASCEKHTDGDVVDIARKALLEAKP